MKSIKKHATLIAIGSLLSNGAVLANPPKPNVFDGGNRWNITFYDDPSSVHQEWGTQEICFLPYAVVGTSIQGVWYSTSFYDWNGRYYQEGDEVKMTGDYANDVGHDHMTLVHTTYDVAGKVRGMAFKDWTEWREDGAYGRIIGWGNAKLERMGYCRNVLEDEALEISVSLPDRLTVRGDIASYPGQRNLESIKKYQDRINSQIESGN